MANVEETLARFRYVIAEQTKALKELRAENERLQTVIAQGADAMTCLQAIYTDPSIKPEIRAAAAKAALPHQRPKLSIQGYANVTKFSPVSTPCSFSHALRRRSTPKKPSPTIKRTLPLVVANPHQSVPVGEHGSSIAKCKGT